MLVTRCPACGTSFRIRPEQLNVRGGRVRCGKCHTAFSALDSLDELSDTGSDPAATTRPSESMLPSSAAESPPAAPTTNTADIAPPAAAPVPTPAVRPVALPPLAPFAVAARQRTDQTPAVPVTPAVQTSPPAPAAERPSASPIQTSDTPPAASSSDANPVPLTAAEEKDFRIDFNLEPFDDNRIEPVVPNSTIETQSETKPEAKSASESMGQSAIATLIDGLTIDPNSEESMRALEASITEAIEMHSVDPEFDADPGLDVDLDFDLDVDKDNSPLHAPQIVAEEIPPPITVKELPAEPVFDLGLPTEPALKEDMHEDMDEPLAFSDEALDPGTVFLEDEFVIPKKEPRRVRLNWWALGSLLLLLTAAIQGIFAFRMDLARAYPAARASLEQACATFGCKVPYPSDADQIIVEGTDLTPDPSGAGHYRLVVTLRNKANYPQNWPQLELTLTDRFDRALARRVLAPRDWLPPAQREKIAFDAQEEVTANVAISTDLPAAGYRVYTFYP
ncbi:MAG TPA: DUF3426 domain-containing protein [Rhodocyclaceae bacterium]|nr:DUF3426 domain-containing protein [Rhodocyclaceae bacterium]